jgi:hypothetical protein
MSAGTLGAWFGGFMMAGLLPAAFLYYGAKNRAAWATVTGAGIAGLLTLGALRGGAFNLGTLAGLALCVWAATRKPSPPK